MGGFCQESSLFAAGIAEPGALVHENSCQTGAVELSQPLAEGLEAGRREMVASVGFSRITRVIVTLWSRDLVGLAGRERFLFVWREWSGMRSVSVFVKLRTLNADAVFLCG